MSVALQTVLKIVPDDVAIEILRQSFCPCGPNPVTIAVPPVRIPDTFLALSPSLMSLALRACAPSIDSDQALDIAVRSPACMEMLAATLPTLPGLQDVEIAVLFEAPEQPYKRMLQAVCALPQLTLLRLSDESVMDHHIIALGEALLQATQLQVLKLDTMPETSDVGVPFGIAVFSLTSLSRIDFVNTEVMQNMPEMICKSGAVVPQLREMHFDRLFITKNDLEPLFGGQRFLPNIELMVLGYHADRYGVGAHDALDVAAMAEASFCMPLLRDLSIRDYRSGSEAGFAKEMLGKPARCPFLSRLDLPYSLHRGDSADLGRLLTEIPQLVSLVLRQLGDGEGALRADEYGYGLAMLTDLTNLDLSGSQLAGASAAALADALLSLTLLVALRLNDTLVVGTSVAENAEVETVMVRGLGAQGGMRELRLEHCFLSPEALALAVEGMPRLRQLWLRGTILGEGGVSALHVPGLQLLHLGQSMLEPRGLRALAPGLHALGALTQLNLSFCQMGREGAEELADALCPEAVASKRQRQAVAPELVVLDVSYSRLGREGAAALLPALLKMQSLREVNLQQAEAVLSDGMLADLRAANANCLIRLLIKAVDQGAAFRRGTSTIGARSAYSDLLQRGHAVDTSAAQAVFLRRP